MSALLGFLVAVPLFIIYFILLVIFSCVVTVTLVLLLNRLAKRVRGITPMNTFKEEVIKVCKQINDFIWVIFRV